LPQYPNKQYPSPEKRRRDHTQPILLGYGYGAVIDIFFD